MSETTLPDQTAIQKDKELIQGQANQDRITRKGSRDRMSRTGRQFINSNGAPVEVLAEKLVFYYKFSPQNRQSVLLEFLG